MRRYLLAILSIFFLACAKDEIEGPKGDKGDQGLNGHDGSKILNGNTKPNMSIGKIGDYYLDLSNSHLYGPKTNNSWGEALPLIGAKGENGADGAKFLSGENQPINAIGKNGDFYFDKINIAIYGPKTETGWGNPIVLADNISAGYKNALIKDIKFDAKNLNNPASFLIISNSYHLSSINLTEGGNTMYWHINDEEGHGAWNSQETTSRNYNMQSWQEMQDFYFQNTMAPKSSQRIFKNTTINFRIYRSAFSDTEIGFGILGSFSGRNGISTSLAIEQAKEFFSINSFDVLIRYIPYQSVEVIEN